MLSERGGRERYSIKHSWSVYGYVGTLASAYIDEGQAKGLRTSY